MLRLKQAMSFQNDMYRVRPSQTPAKKSFYEAIPEN